MRLATSMSRLGTETAFDVLVRARNLEAQGRHVVHLEIGEPDFDTPLHVREAAKQALDEGWTHYGPPQGFPELRQAIADHISATRGIPSHADQICVTPGGKPILFFSMMALVEPGDEVIFPNPGFPIYESMIHYLGAVPIPVPLMESRGFSFNLDLFKERLTNRTKLIILNSPQNPTGGVIPEEDLAAIASLIRERDVMVLSDEIYSQMSYGAPPVSITKFPGIAEKAILLDGFSKAYAMTGWRVGYGMMPVWIAQAVSRLMVNSNSCTASFSQRAAIAALRGPQDFVKQMMAEFRCRRDAFVAGLNQIPGFRCALPEGAFYAFPNIDGTGWKSKELSEALLDHAGVACLSGPSFGSCGEGYLRFSYANSMANLAEAVDRIRRFLAKG
jgi:aspartate aminotransferase